MATDAQEKAGKCEMVQKNDSFRVFAAQSDKKPAQRGLKS